MLDNVLFIAFENSQLLLVDLDPNGLVHSVANIGDALAYFNGPRYDDKRAFRRACR